MSHDLNGLASASAPPRDDVSTFEAVYAEHFDFTWRVLKNLVGPARGVDDAAQELWTVVHRRLGDFEHRSSVRTWLFSIALNVARNQRRAESKHAALELLPELVPSASSDPEAERAATETWRSLIRFLDALEETDRAIFVSSVLEDLSAKETAEALGVGVMIIYQRVRTLRRLAKAWLELHERGSIE
ncbi:MAG TPA: sigma-70 family RNA polymerase sigma factor [Polyangiaceae bacterium]|nr:sigma-70 family RNA polymerase sigma factor [Polyangiaceae bacterium]